MYGEGRKVKENPEQQTYTAKIKNEEDVERLIRHTMNILRKHKGKIKKVLLIVDFEKPSN